MKVISGYYGPGEARWRAEVHRTRENDGVDAVASVDVTADCCVHMVIGGVVAIVKADTCESCESECEYRRS